MISRNVEVNRIGPTRIAEPLANDKDRLGVAFSPDGDRHASRSQDNTVEFRNKSHTHTLPTAVYWISDPLSGFRDSGCLTFPRPRRELRTKLEHTGVRWDKWTGEIRKKSAGTGTNS
jgi:hypothetical protein